jgi:hypothetical protein
MGRGQVTFAPWVRELSCGESGDLPQRKHKPPMRFPGAEAQRKENKKWETAE